MSPPTDEQTEAAVYRTSAKFARVAGHIRFADTGDSIERKRGFDWKTVARTDKPAPKHDRRLEAFEGRSINRLPHRASAS
jgi:hypothetical protein